MQPATPPDLLGLDAPKAWDTELAFAHLKAQGDCDSKRTAERRIRDLGVIASPLAAEDLRNERGDAPTRMLLDWELEEERSRRHLVLFVQLHRMPTGRLCLQANDARGANFWIPLEQGGPAGIAGAIAALHAHVGKPIGLFPHGDLVGPLRSMRALDGVTLHHLFHHPVPEIPAPTPLPRHGASRSHLDRLEDESIHILREAMAQSERPVMLYSIGKDSSVMVHLARKAFFPARPPFPLMHIDTRWKFREMYYFRETMAKLAGMELIRFVNPEAVERDINPFDHGSSLHTHITKTEGLKKALDLHRFDLAFGGARRDEEKSRAKERVFSFRSAAHRWDPKNQRPEVWNLYNARKAPGESIRVFPLSNWTELDVWEYILREGIPVVPLYFAKERPVVERDGTLLMVDDDRMRLLPGERIQRRRVRFRTLGCYPLSGAFESDADSLEAIMAELIAARTSERQGRMIDHDQAASMEKKKHEGYF
ncbi:MAG: sulfate adenylyltransferase subunit CysD [Planctomycetes bacterium]|nr:sulfate adenylyltransferase subunit CysD [Planctomycetota bacterium]